jgi:serine phosphatase RsbU (regulator of sigma subunit)
VCGHGPERHEDMLLVRQAVREAARLGLGPAETLRAANRFVCNLDRELYATACFALLDTRSRVLSFANAGHPPPLIVESAGSSYLTYPHADLILGISAPLMPKLRVAQLTPQTLLVLYTDGVTDRDRRPWAGEARLRAAALSAYEHRALPSASVIESLMLLTGPNPDDAAILAAWIARERSSHPAPRATAAVATEPIFGRL